MHSNPEQTLAQGTQALEERCERAKLPVTVQRRAVFEALFNRTDHPTVETVYSSVQEQMKGVSKATVYRALETLTDLGLARKVAHPGSAVRFDPNTSRHHHLLCDECGAISDHADAEITFEAPKGSFVVREASVLFRGTCADCV